MAAFPRSKLRTAILTCAVLILVTISVFHDHRASPIAVRSGALSDQVNPQCAGSAIPHFTRLDLDEGTCRSAFPGLFSDIDAAVSQGPFQLTLSPVDYKGLTQARIKNGNLHILTASTEILPQILHQRTAVLSQIHRSIITSPEAIPDTFFSFTINDVPKNNSWGFARPNKHTKGITWLIPTFAGWSWPKAHLDPIDEVLRRINDIESSMNWAEKADKAVWRGTPWFNPIGHPNLRKDLLKATKGKEWADIKALNATNALKIEDFCRYKYVVYTEGVTYSGRLPYHQACGSVLIMAPLTWLTTSALLVRPISAERLMQESGMEVFKSDNNKVAGALPTVSSYEDANAIYVNHDYSNLEALIEFLHAHPEVARRIARNQRDRMVGGGYLGLTAETCYWRALIRGWSKVAVVDEKEWGIIGGERYETWLSNEVSRPKEVSRGKSDG